ncbi:MAG: SDR family oxidoreductase [Anaerolineales bacterium]|nr:SDR family oxidoreductase [Anaerolineales bacterium]
MDLGLTGKTALVTAASRGLGKAAALALAAEGARVVFSSHSEKIHSAAEEIQSHTGQLPLAIQADLTQPEDIRALVQQTIESCGHIDILIINAGGPPPGNFLNLTPDDWRSAIDLTLMSTVHLCYEVIPHMKKAGSGSIVTSQSFTVKQPLDNLVLSNALRMAVIGLMKSLANELGPHGIRVNSINPAWTRTERVTQLLQHRAGVRNTTIEEETAQITADIPLGRMGTPEEFGRTIAWLVSPAASFIHGHALMFDGGEVRAAL